MAGIINIYGNKEDILIIRKPLGDISLSESSSYDEEVLAYIVPDTAGNSWRMIRGQESERIIVNGEPLHLVHYLSLGDRIIFGDGKTVFRFMGARPIDNGEPIARFRKTMIAFSALVLLVMAVFIAGAIRSNTDADIRAGEIRRYQSSVYKISVEKVIYQTVTATGQGFVYDAVDSLILDTSFPSGTGFLCTDGKFVTARHCIEPWIVTNDPGLLYDSPESDERTLTVWAADAETYNIRHKKDSIKTHKRLVSICKVSLEGGESEYFSSDTAFFCIKNDIVRNLRGVRNPLYWRELGHIRSRSSLGDVVYFQTEHKGRIRLADQAYIDSLETDTPAVHLGYPLGQSDCSFERSRVMMKRQKNMCLGFKDTDVAKGYSGGPVMVRHNGKLLAVGVLSRIFDNEQRSSVCVPASEIENAERRWEE